MRRYFQFSIRSLLVLTTLSAILCAFGVPAAKRYIAQRERERLAAEQRERERLAGLGRVAGVPNPTAFGDLDFRQGGLPYYYSKPQ